MANKSQLRDFRAKIAELKRRGLLSGIDARSATPTRSLKRAIEKYEPVLSGKATPVKLSRLSSAEKSNLKKLHTEIAAPRGLPKQAIIPHGANEKVVVSHGTVQTRHAKGITKKNVAIEYHNLEEYLTAMSEMPSEPNTWYCMKVYSDYTRCYRTIELLIEEVSKYKSFETALGMRPKDQTEFYHHLQIIHVDDPDEREVLQARASAKKHKKKTGKSDKAKYNARMARLKSGPKWKLADYRAKQAKRQRDYRKRHGK